MVLVKFLNSSHEQVKATPMHHFCLWELVVWTNTGGIDLEETVFCFRVG